MLEDIKRVKDKVMHVLHHYPETRASDKKLMLKVWELFYGLELDDRQRAKFMNCPVPESVRRVRQNIQNTIGRYKPLSEVERERLVEETRVRVELQTKTLF